MEEKGAPERDQAGHQGLGISRRRPPKPSGAGSTDGDGAGGGDAGLGLHMCFPCSRSSVWSVDPKPWLRILLGQGPLTSGCPP